ncbi:cytochrome P450 [Pholiota conissans]|uniref:Cytochrome P450 n=1 Tax=Pholiota conissans TaxID=109636 RepID=A0A9P5Z202_9AGAR|nr:cytochrome P450 [Pholiota conissans]
MSYFGTTATLIVALLLAGITKLLFKRKAQTTSYAPGPKPKPLIGNLLDIPSKHAARVFARWGKTYNSDILFASTLGNHILVLNKLEDVEELLDRRSRIYSDRQVVPMMKLMGWDHNIGLLQYGDKWRVHRKICQQNFNARAALDYQPMIKSKINDLLQGLLVSPERFEEHNKTFSTSIPLASMYGYDVDTLDHQWVKLADESLLMGAKLLLPGASLINVFPFLQHIPEWFPGASTRRTAGEVKKLTDYLIKSPFDWVKKRMQEGMSVPSLVTNYLESKGKDATPEDEIIVSDIAYSIYVGASDTTISLGLTFLYLMTIHPEIQKKAQAEIDRVTGGSRLPDFEDRSSLPYIEAMYRELMRWMPPVPLGLPHRLTEDDEYKGYFIPKGTAVMANIWAMSRDEERYPEPHLFKPERFLDENGEINDDDHILAFGFGRRICVGKHVATHIIWMMITSIIAAFDVSKAKDNFGNDIEIEDDYTDYGALLHKSSFKCSIKPRSAAARELILEKEN